METDYKITREGSANVLTLSGRLDTMSARELENHIRPLVDNPGTALTVKIDGLSYISSSGLRCLVQLFNAARGAGAPFRIEGARPSVREIFDITGFSRIFGLE